LSNLFICQLRLYLFGNGRSTGDFSKLIEHILIVNVLLV
jgi:hypothetical protein